MGCFGGGGLTNEKAYQLGKFARVALGTSQIDYHGRSCMSSAAAATNRAFGIDRGLPLPLAGIAAADVIYWSAPTPADTMPTAMQWFDEGSQPRRDAHHYRPATFLRRPWLETALAAGARHRPGTGQRLAAPRDPARVCRHRLHR